MVQIRRSMTDQGGRGTSVGLPFGSDPNTCPVRTLRAWLEAAGISDGPIFRPAAHSLRTGPTTSAIEGGAHGRDVMRHSRHRSVTVFRGYVRDVGLFDANTAAAAGL